MDRCVFCEILEGREPGSIVYRERDVAVVMDIQPINAGHMLVIPAQHTVGLGDLDPAVGARVFQVAQTMAKALRASTLPCDGVNLFLADGRAAMQEVFHVHLHVIPRVTGDGFGLRFGGRYVERPERSELESAAAALRKALGAKH
jgi:diadenosine tetraphosphate (Ap4A) HIT family hydrolase